MRFDGRRYVIDRAVRILLPLISSLIIVYIVNQITGNTKPLSIYIINLLSLQGIVGPSVVEPFWSLSYEVWFYIIFGMLGYFIINRKGKWLALFAISSLFYICKLHIYCMLIWMIGALYRLISPPKPSSYKITLSIIGMLIFSALIFIKGKITFINEDIVDSIIYTIYAIIAGYFILMIANMDYKSGVTKAINTIGRKLAAFSYTLYLTHWSILQLLDYYGVPHFQEYSIKSIIIMLIYCVICLCAAYLIYLPFEKQTSRVKNYIYTIIGNK